MPDDENGLATGKALGEKQQVMKRFGTIEEAGKLCLFIAADATFTTGVDHLLVCHRRFSDLKYAKCDYQLVESNYSASYNYYCHAYNSHDLERVGLQDCK